MVKEMTAEEINKKYKGKYIEVYRDLDFQNDQYVYEVRKVYAKIHENSTLGEDVGTEQEYRR